MVEIRKPIGYGTQTTVSTQPGGAECSDCDPSLEMNVEVAPQDRFSAKAGDTASNKDGTGKGVIGGFFSNANKLKAELAEKAKVAQEKWAALQKRTSDLIHPLVDHTGTLDFSQHKGKSFEGFREFLLAQAEQNDGKSFSSPYADLLAEKKYEPLLELLYQLSNSEYRFGRGQSPSPTDIEALLREFMAELIDIDADALVGRFIGMKCCRDMLSEVIKDDRYSRDTRIDLLEAIRRIGRDYVDRGKIDNIDENLSWFNLNSMVSDSDLARATGSAIYIIEAIEKAEAAREVLFKDTANEYARLAAEKKARPDTVSQLQGSLAEIIVTASSGGFIGQLKGVKDERGAGRIAAEEKIRSHIIKEAKRLYQAGETVKTDKELARYNEELQKFLKGSWNHLFAGSLERVLGSQLELDGGISRKAVFKTRLDDSLNNGLADMVSGISATYRQPFDSLGSTSDMIHHAQSMGEAILDSATSAISEDKELKEATENLAHALTNTRLKLWHGYKQHGALSRGMSNVANVVGGSGNIARIEAANAELKEITGDILYAIDQNELETAIQRLQRGLEEDGVIHKAIDAAEMDGVETSINFLQTTLEIIAIALVTKGAGATLGAGRGAAAGGEAAISAAGRTSKIVQYAKEAGIRSARGFGMGAQISVAENAVSVATDQVGAKADLEKWIKDAIATGLSMAITGLLPASAAKGNIIEKIWQRYTVGGLRAAGRFGVDTGVETLEEAVNQMILQALDGNFDALSFAQLAELVRVCAAGGGLKVGAIAEAIKSDSVAQGFSRGGALSPPVEGKQEGRGGALSPPVEGKLVEPTLVMSTPTPAVRSAIPEAKFDLADGKTPPTWVMPNVTTPHILMPEHNAGRSAPESIKYLLVPSPNGNHHFILWSPSDGISYEIDRSMQVIKFKIADQTAVDSFLAPKRPDVHEHRQEIVSIREEEGDDGTETLVTLVDKFAEYPIFRELSSPRELAGHGYRVEVELPKSAQEAAERLGDVETIGQDRIRLTIAREADIPVLDIAAEFGQQDIAEGRTLPVAEEDAMPVAEATEPSEGSPMVAPQIEYLHAGFDPRPGLRQGLALLQRGIEWLFPVENITHSLLTPNKKNVHLMSAELVINMGGRTKKIDVEMETANQEALKKRADEIAKILSTMPPAMLGRVRTIRVFSKNAEAYGYESCSSAYSDKERAIHIYDGAGIRRFKPDVDWDLHDLRHELAHSIENGELEKRVKQAIELGGSDAEKFYHANAFKSEWKKDWRERWATAVTMYLADPAKFKVGDPRMADLIEAQLGLEVPNSQLSKPDPETATRPGLKQGLALLQRGIELLFPGSEAKMTGDEVIGPLTYADIEGSFIEPRVEWGYHDPQGVHGLGHISRVQVLSDIIARAFVNSGKKVNVKVLRWAAVLHDVARKDDQDDPNHGIRSAIWAREHLKELDPSLTEEDIVLIAHIIQWHVPADSRHQGEMPVELTILKDADALDRARFAAGRGGLDPKLLRTDEAKALIDVAVGLYNNSQDYFNEGVPWPDAVTRETKRGLAFFRSQKELDRGGPDTFEMSALQMLGFEIYDGISRIAGSEAGVKNIETKAEPEMLENRHLLYKGSEWVPERQLTENIFYYKNIGYTGKHSDIGVNKALFVRVVDGVATLLDRETARKLVLDAYEYRTGQSAVTAPNTVFARIKAMIGSLPISAEAILAKAQALMDRNISYLTVTYETEALHDLAYFADGEPEGIPNRGIFAASGNDKTTSQPFQPQATMAEIKKHTQMAPTLALLELGERTDNEAQPSYSGCFGDMLFGPNGKIDLEQYGPLLQEMQSRLGGFKLDTDRKRSLAVDLYLRFSKVDEKALNALGFSDAIDATKKVWRVYVGSYYKNLPPLAPKMLAIEQIPEIIEKLTQYAPVESLNHGSTSASLPGVVATGGLLPAKYILQEDNPMLFSGELVFQLHGTGELKRSTSTAHFSRTDPAQPQIQVPGYSNWSPDIIYARSKGNEFGKEESSDHLTKDQKEKRERKIAYMRKAWAKGLPPLERAMVAEEFPVVYQVRQFDGERVINDKREAEFLAQEREYHGKLVLGENITEIFVPRNKVELVKVYLLSHGFDNVDVLPIENLEMARMLLIEEYQLFYGVKEGKDPMQEYHMGLDAAFSPLTNNRTVPQYGVTAPSRKRAFGAPMPGDNGGHYVPRLSQEEWARGRQGPNTSVLDEAAPLGGVGRRKAEVNRFGSPGSRAPGAPADRRSPFVALVGHVTKEFPGLFSPEDFRLAHLIAKMQKNGWNFEDQKDALTAYFRSIEKAGIEMSSVRSDLLSEIELMIEWLAKKGKPESEQKDISKALIEMAGGRADTALSFLHLYAKHYNDIDTAIKKLSELFDTARTGGFVLNKNIAVDMDAAMNNSLGAVTFDMAVEAALNRSRYLQKMFGSNETPSRGDYQYSEPLAAMKLNDSLEMHLEVGQYEAGGGLQFTLYHTASGDDMAMPLGSVGFLETDRAIIVTRYQGADIADKELSETLGSFREFSGGTDPMPWLGFVAGRFLLDMAQSRGKKLQWLAGEYALFGYPHKVGQNPEGIGSIEEARAYWSAPQPTVESARKQRALLAKNITELEQEIERLKIDGGADNWNYSEIGRADGLLKLAKSELKNAKMLVELYDRGPHVAKINDATAQNLGFRKKKNAPFWTYTKSPDEFGKNLRSKGLAERDIEQFERSVKTAGDEFGVKIKANGGSEIVQSDHNTLGSLAHEAKTTPFPKYDRTTDETYFLVIPENRPLATDQSPEALRGRMLKLLEYQTDTYIDTLINDPDQTVRPHLIFIPPEQKGRRFCPVATNDVYDPIWNAYRAGPHDHPQVKESAQGVQGDPVTALTAVSGKAFSSHMEGLLRRTTYHAMGFMNAFGVQRFARFWSSSTNRYVADPAGKIAGQIEKWDFSEGTDNYTEFLRGVLRGMDEAEAEFKNDPEFDSVRNFLRAYINDPAGTIEAHLRLMDVIYDAEDKPADRTPETPPALLSPRTRTPGAPMPGVKGRYEARRPPEERANGLPGPNTFGLDEAAPLGRVGARIAEAEAGIDRIGNRAAGALAARIDISPEAGSKSGFYAIPAEGKAITFGRASSGSHQPTYSIEEMDADGNMIPAGEKGGVLSREQVKVHYDENEKDWVIENIGGHSTNSVLVIDEKTEKAISPPLPASEFGNRSVFVEPGRYRIVVQAEDQDVIPNGTAFLTERGTIYRDTVKPYKYSVAEFVIEIPEREKPEMAHDGGVSGQGNAGGPYIPRRGEGSAAEGGGFLGAEFGAGLRARQQAAEAKIGRAGGRGFHVGAPNGAAPRIAITGKAGLDGLEIAGAKTVVERTSGSGDVEKHVQIGNAVLMFKLTNGVCMLQVSSGEVNIQAGDNTADATIVEAGKENPLNLRYKEWTLANGDILYVGNTKLEFTAVAKVPSQLTIAINGGEPVALKPETKRIVIGQDPATQKDPPGTPLSAHVRIRAGDERQCTIERSPDGRWRVIQKSKIYPTNVTLPDGKRVTIAAVPKDSKPEGHVISIPIIVTLLPGKNIIEVEGKKITINIPESDRLKTPKAPTATTRPDLPASEMPTKEIPLIDSSSGSLKIPAKAEKTSSVTVSPDLAYAPDGKTPSLVGTIDGLTPELERKFASGARVDKSERSEPGKIVYLMDEHAKGGVGNTRALDHVYPSDPEYATAEKQYKIFTEWHAKAGFVKISPEEARRNFSALTGFLKQRGIEFDDGEASAKDNFDPSLGSQYQEALNLLKLCPDALLRSGALKRIVFNAGRTGGGRIGGFENGTARMVPESLKISRKMFQHFFLHEIGHAIHEGLAPADRTRFQSLLTTILKTHVPIAVDTAIRSVAERIGYISNLDEFLAETNTLYIMAGDFLRSRISHIKKGPARKAYEEIYDFYRNLHGGREFISRP